MMTGSPSAVARWAREKPECRLVVLFGREPKGWPREGRDFDLAVLFQSPPDPEDRLRIMGELQELAAPRDPDVFFLRPEADPLLHSTVSRDGECLFEAGPDILDTLIRPKIIPHE